METQAPDTVRHPGPTPGGNPDLDRNPVKVLVVEAAPASRRLLVELLRADPQIRVIAEFADPQEAAGFLQHTRADVVLMDQDGPGAGCVAGTRRIMETHPTPIVLCTAAECARDAVFRSLETGAVACVDKPQHGDARVQADRSAHMRLTLKLMSEVKVVRRWARGPATPRAATVLPRAAAGPDRPVRIIGIGASTGGPPVLQTIFSGLPANLDVPILVVQHLAAGFLPAMAQWLRQTSGLPVDIASHGAIPRPGHVYLGPDNCQMGMNGAGRIVISHTAGDAGLQPSVAHLFQTLADVYGPQAVGVLLTGMGKDGAAGLKQMRDRGATTIAQDRETSVVHGMPGEAIALGGAVHVLPAQKIAGALHALVQTNRYEGN